MTNINFSREDIIISNKTYAYYRTTGKLNIGCGKQQGFGMFVRFSGDNSVSLGVDLKESDCDLYRLSLEDFYNSLHRRFILSSLLNKKFRIAGITLQRSEIVFDIKSVELLGAGLSVTKGMKWGMVGDFFDVLEKYLSEDCLFDGVSRKILNYGQYH